MFEAQLDHYEVLGVAPEATADEIRRSYRFLVMAFHPDKYSRSPEYHLLANARVKQINEAYQVLSNEKSRSRYDLVRSLTNGDRKKVPFVQSPQELAEALNRIHQLERDLHTAQARVETLGREKTELERRLAFGERSAGERTQRLEAERRMLQLQLEQLTRERIESERSARQHADGLEQQLAVLRAGLERRESLLAELTKTKADWERSSQSRFDIVNRQLLRLRGEVERKDAEIAEAVAAQKSAEENLVREKRKARRTIKQLNDAVRAGETDLARLEVSLQAQESTEHRHHQTLRLWQVAAVIGLVNTIILFLVALQRLAVW